MNCIYCETTDCILDSEGVFKDGTRVFTDLRFDVESKQLDINFGTLAINNRPDESYWSNAVDINFCPFCGKELE